MLNLSETQWVVGGLILALTITAIVCGYFWQKAKNPSSGVSMIPLQSLYPEPTKNQEWSYGHEFAPPEVAPPHDPGHSVESGAPLDADYCRWGTTPIGIVDGENDLTRFQIYTVQPSMHNLKYYKQGL